MSIKHTTKGSILDDLGLTPAQAEHLKIRAQLLNEIKAYIKSHNMTQQEASRILRIDQARVSKLLAGHIELFTIDRLVKMLSQLGLHLHIKVAA